MKRKTYWYDVQGIELGKKRMTTGEMKKYAKKMLKVSKKQGLDTHVTSRDLNNDMNAWVYLKNIGCGLRTNRKEW